MLVDNKQYAMKEDKKSKAGIFIPYTAFLTTLIKVNQTLTKI